MSLVEEGLKLGRSGLTRQDRVEVDGEGDVEDDVDDEHDDGTAERQAGSVPKVGPLGALRRADLQQQRFVHAQREAGRRDQRQQPIEEGRRRVARRHLDVVEQVQEGHGHGAEDAGHLCYDP